MSRRAARRLLWVAAALLLPLPYLVTAEGAVPIVRFVMLGSITAAYSALVDGSGVAWVFTALMLGHALVYALVLWAAAALVARVVPTRVRGVLVAALVGAGVAGAFAFEPYHTPFAAESAWTSWPGLLR